MPQLSPNYARVLLLAIFTMLVVWWVSDSGPRPRPHSFHSHGSDRQKPTIITDPTAGRPSTSYAGRGGKNLIDLSTARSPFVSWPLARVCAETTYVPGLVFVCDNNSGGPGNIRNYILTCLRYAVEAGATSLVVPRIRTRDADDPSDLFREYKPFGYMFDEAHFRSALNAVCPRIEVYETVEDIPGVREKEQRENLPAERMTEWITPKHFGGSRAGCDQRDQNRHTDRFGAALREWVVQSAIERNMAPTTVENPRLVRFSWGVLWDWPVYRDGPEFVATFGALLRIREDIIELAERIVDSIRELAVSSPSQTTSEANPASEETTIELGQRSFLGIHLRTEEDALSQWPSYENQSEGYIREAERRGFGGGFAYLASGSETEARRFSEKAMSAMQLNVRTKHDLVAGRELEKLKAMSWDQQALVDFVVLLSSDYFLGVSPSSFSINIALKRHLHPEGLFTRPWRVGGSGDGRSWLVGSYDRYWEDWLFMFDGMWP